VFAWTARERQPREAPVPFARQAGRLADVEPTPSIAFLRARHSWDEVKATAASPSPRVRCGRPVPACRGKARPRAWCVTEAVTARRRNRDSASRGRKNKNPVALALALARTLRDAQASFPAGPFSSREEARPAVGFVDFACSCSCSHCRTRATSRRGRGARGRAGGARR